MSKESEVQKAIIEYLHLMKIWNYRNNSGALKTERGHFVRFGAKGSPDIICVIDGQYVGIECKSHSGRQSEHQKAFQEGLEEHGGAYCLARSVDDVIEFLDKQKSPG